MNRSLIILAFILLATSLRTESTFKPFDTIQEAQTFMGSLSKSAEPSMYYGVVTTDEEKKAQDDYYAEENRKIDQQGRDLAKLDRRIDALNEACDACQKSGRSDCDKYCDEAQTLRWHTFDYVGNAIMVFFRCDSPRWVVVYKK